MPETSTMTTTTTTWQIDPAHSSIEFAVKHMMFTTVRGRFKDVKGTIAVNEQSPDNSSVNVEIDAASLDTGVADRDAHLRSADFLDVENHKTITFRSKRLVKALAAEGDRLMVLDVEEVGRAKMGVAVRDTGVEARGIDLDVHRRVVRALLIDRDRSLDVLETAAHGREHHVLHRELDARMSRVDLPCGGGGRHRACLWHVCSSVPSDST